MKRIILLALVLTATLGLASSAKAQDNPQEKPNIVYILADDMRADDMQYMPKTQSLIGGKGTTFENAYVSQPYCCPSRSTMLTGLYPHNHGVHSNNNGAGVFRKKGNESRTYAVALQAAGYRTGLFGKYLNEYNGPYIPPGWDEWHAFSGKGSVYYGYHLSENGVSVPYGRAEEDYSTDVLSNEVDTFVQSGGPFMAFLSIYAPHPPSTPAPRYASYVGTDRAKTLQAADDAVEAMVNALEASGQLDNTYIFFASDNGYMLGEHGTHGKKLPWEESVKIPLLVRGPGVAVGKRDELVLNNDLAPTFAEIAQTTMPQGVDGRSLVELLDGTSESWRKRILMENGAPRPAPFKAVRDERYKLVTYPGHSGPSDKLFDLQVDPTESLNLIHDPAYASVKADLHTKLDALKDCSTSGPVSCQVAEDT